MRTILSQTLPALRRIACLALVAGALSGCVVVPAYHYHPYYYR
jgi:hypothetical protein